MIDILVGIVASDTMKKSKERFSRFYVSLMQRGTYIYTHMIGLLVVLILQIIGADFQELIY